MKIKMTILFGWLVGLIAVTTGAAEPSKPNIVIILADDLGFSDIGSYGGEIQTPNLDGLAKNGLRFTQFYNTARCWSSRSSLMSGYYAQSIRRDNITDRRLSKNFGQIGAGGTPPRWSQLLPAYLKPIGYQCYMSGKSHLPGDMMEQGFDHAYIAKGSHGFFSNDEDTSDGKPVPAVKIDGSYYSTIDLADHAIKDLKEHAAQTPAKPFFLYLAFHCPHFPIQALPEDIEIYKDRYTSGWDAIREERIARMKKLGIVSCDLSPLDPETIPTGSWSEDRLKKKIGPGEVGYAVPWDSLNQEQKKFQAAKMAVHAAMIHRMDIEIGRVMDQIQAMGSLDNTIVFFLSDNGASAEQMIRGLGEDPKAPIGSAYSYLGIGPGWASAANTPFRLYKMWNHEGGIATPLIVCWPDGIKTKGDLRTDPGHLIDIVPTVLELTGGKQPEKVEGLTVPPLPGKSLVPDFARDGMIKRDYLWWNHKGNRAIRVGDWKLVADGEKPWELYDMSKDRSETKNLVAQFPEKAKELERLWNKNADDMHTLALQDPPANPGGKKGNSDGDEEL